MSIIPIIVKRRKDIVDKFVNANALEEKTAQFLEALNLEANEDIEFLLRKGTLVKTEGGKYFLDPQKKFFQ